jgi:hypothetical protein
MGVVELSGYLTRAEVLRPVLVSCHAVIATHPQRLPAAPRFFARFRLLTAKRNASIVNLRVKVSMERFRNLSYGPEADQNNSELLPSTATPGNDICMARQ